MKARQNIVAMCYDKRGRLISIGRNSYIKTHPLQMRYANHTSNEHRIFLHAELDALIKSHGTKVHKLVVLRYMKGGGYGNAAPCECCQKAIKDFGVNVVEHS